jgi:hypothetical protein
MHDYRSVGEQIFSGIFIALFILFSPIIGIYKLMHWFLSAVVKETGNRIVKWTGGGIAFAIILYATQFLSSHF